MSHRENALAKETSPYLLQHARNPVAWYPWGEEAFALARERQQPIFLSVGYSTCYWCHVMERQVFENEAIAAVMNEHFVNIKVDREERPDVDDLYMTAVQLMTRHGGWPMSVFLTPPGARGDDDAGLLPFYAGTYFPPTASRGMPGFPDIVRSLAGAWADRRDEVLTQADNVAQAVRSHFTPDELTVRLAPDVLWRAANQLMTAFEPRYGGFSGAPKFPQPCTLAFLLALAEGDEDGGPGVLRAVVHTLNRMACGGIYDQVGGGFHRYSTDERWLVPHFEKMLYDNAQLVALYLTARGHAPAADPDRYVRVARETCEYVLREMLDPAGTFWSAQDAEVEAREGGNYVWTEAEVQAAVGDGPLASVAVSMYGLDAGPNFRDPHDEGAAPVNVLHLPTPLDAFAEREGRALETVLRDRAEINRRLYAARSERPQPLTDDKTLVAWNGMMIAAFADAGRALDEPRYLDAARRAAAHILDHLRTPEGTLLRTMREGRAKVDACLEDYASLVHGLLALARQDSDAGWLDTARSLDALAKAQFSAPGGGYFDAPASHGELFARTRALYDGAVPTANSQMIHNQVDLYQLTGEAAYLERARTDLASFAARLAEAGAGLTHMLHAMYRLGRATGDAVPAGSPVRAVIEPGTVVFEGGRANARLLLDIEDGYHVSAVTGPETAALDITLEGAPGVRLEVEAPGAVERAYAFADRPLAVYDGRAVFDLAFSVEAPPTLPPGAAVHVSYQACTDTSCLVPTRVVLPISFR